MKIFVRLICKKFIQYHNLNNKIHKNHIYFEIQRVVYGLSQAGKLANNLPQKDLKS